MVKLDADGKPLRNDNSENERASNLPPPSAALPQTVAYTGGIFNIPTPQPASPASASAAPPGSPGSAPAPQAPAPPAAPGFGFNIPTPQGMPPNVVMPPGANMATFPEPRRNPHCYIITGPNYYTVVKTEQMERLEAARRSGQPYVDIGNGRQVDLQFKQCPTVPDAGVNAKGDCYEYIPRWFFLDNQQRWSPLSPHMNYLLNKAKHEGVGEATDSERTYDLLTFNQINRESKRRRPLLFLRDDGTAVRGDAVAMWAYEGQFRGASSTLSVPFEVAEALDKAVAGGAPSCTVQFKPQGLNSAAKVLVTFRSGSNTHDGVADDGSGYQRPFKFTRYFPTWFFLDSDRHWCSLDYATTSRLDLAAAAGLFTTADHEREYDMVRLEQRNLQSGRIRPLVQVRGHNTSAPTADPASQNAHPQVFARAKLLTNPAVTIDGLKAKIADENLTPVERVLHFCNGLIRFHRFVVKGGIIRDAVVKNDISKSHDIDIELPQVFQQHQLDTWVSKFLEKIKNEFGVERDPNKNYTKRDSWDVFGPAIGRSSVSEGIVTIPVKLPGATGPQLDLECVTPWNQAYSPPRNMDLSVNNLRATADTPELGLSVVIFHDDGKTRYTVKETIDQILRGECSPCYDFKWVPGEPGKTGEGRDGTKWCVGHCDANPTRAKNMDGRFEKMRSKGYRLVEGPPLATNS